VKQDQFLVVVQFELLASHRGERSLASARNDNKIADRHLSSGRRLPIEWSDLESFLEAADTASRVNGLV
jgi:hypothetical protein